MKRVSPFLIDNQFIIKMCLHTKQIMPLKARRDITCFKIVLSLKSQDNFYYTPFQHMRMTIGEICCAVGPLLPKPVRFLSISRPIGVSSLYCVEDGYIHAFTNQEEAKIYCRVVSKRCTNFQCYVVKCTIPKDTLYFVSARRDYEICARNIMPMELIAGYLHGNCNK